MSTARPRLVFAWPYAGLGGSQIYLLKIATVLRERFDISAVMPESASPALQQYWRDIGATCRLVPQDVDDRAEVRGVARVRRRVTQWRAEYSIGRSVMRTADGRRVVHLDMAPWTSFWMLLALLRSGPVVVTLHTRLPYPGALRRASWRAKLALLCRQPGFRIIAASRHVRESLREYLTAAQVARVPVAYSPVDLDEIAGVDRPAAADGAGPFDVVTVGQFVDRKGPWVLLEAARIVRSRGARARFTWLCPRPPTAGQQRRIATYDLGEAFTWQSHGDGRSTRQTLLARVGRADLFVLPSLEEGLPLALVEAMALGVPVIGTRINGVPEAVTHDADGLLVEPGDARALADALTGLLEDREKRVRLGTAARERARREFNATTTAAVVEAVYRDLLDEAI